MVSVLLLAFGAPLALAWTFSPIFGRDVSPDNTCGRSGHGGSPSAFTCPANLPCCSVYGYCGATAEYCLISTGCQSEFGNCTTSEPEQGTSGDGRCGPAFGNISCSPTECCSAAGFCGTTTDHCKAPDCLFQYGPSCDANQSPAGLNTSDVSRAKVGEVLYGGDGVFNCVNPGDVALTYDDGPFLYTNDLLDLLRRYNASATFMVTGNNNGKGEIDDSNQPWANDIRRMFNEGHQIASHTWSHADLCNITSAERKNEMYKLEMALRNIIGVFPTYMRPPFSSCTAECGCVADMNDLGYHIAYFDLDTQDYLNISPELIQNAKDIVDQSIAVKTAPNENFLVIGHDIHQQTVYNLTEHMLQKFDGRRMVTLGECLGDPRDNWYRTDTRTTLGSP